MLKPQKLSEIILQELEQQIVAGKLLDGQKIPSERELASQYQVSRPSVREAIQKLEARGWVVRRQGGGTFVCKPQAQVNASSALMQLINEDPETQFDLLEFRHTLEGMAAYYAALRAQPEDINRIEHAYRQLRGIDAEDYQAQAVALAQFYLRLTEAAHNGVLLKVFESLQSALQDNILRNLKLLDAQPESLQRIASQREHILSAVKQRNPEAAREASNTHLAYIEKTLLDINRQDSRMQRALRRIEV